jgi:uncharacterized membrane protein SirB2
MRSERANSNPLKDKVLLASGFGFLAIGNLTVLFTDQQWIPTILIFISIIICTAYIVLQFND